MRIYMQHLVILKKGSFWVIIIGINPNLKNSDENNQYNLLFIKKKGTNTCEHFY